MSLVREKDAPRFIAEVKEQYFMPLVASGVVKEEDLGECLFASKPASGAALMKLQLAPAEPAGQPGKPAAQPAEQDAAMYEI